MALRLGLDFHTHRNFYRESLEKLQIRQHFAARLCCINSVHEFSASMCPPIEQEPVVKLAPAPRLSVSALRRRVKEVVTPVGLS